MRERKSTFIINPVSSWHWTIPGSHGPKKGNTSIGSASLTGTVNLRDSRKDKVFQSTTYQAWLPFLLPGNYDKPGCLKPKPYCYVLGLGPANRATTLQLSGHLGQRGSQGLTPSWGEVVRGCWGRGVICVSGVASDKLTMLLLIPHISMLILCLFFKNM